MNRPSSSTSSSERPANDDAPGPAHPAEIARVVVWFCVFLVGYDALAGIVSRAPKVPRSVRVFFDYGLSIEEKHFRAVGLTSESPSAIRDHGFLEPSPEGRSWGADPPVPGGLRISVYGMSFSEDVGKAIARLDPSATVRCLGAASAPANHSLALFEGDPGKAGSDVAILGVLGSSVTGVLTRCMTWYFVSPYQYTYPKYARTSDGGVDASWPPLRSYREFREALEVPSRWEPFVDQIRGDDPFYDPFLFRRTVLDHSTTVCLLRKAWAQWQLQRITGRTHSGAGFHADSGLIQTLRAILLTFGASARAEGKFPVVLLLGDRGYDGHLDAAVGPALRDAGIRFVSTHDICPLTDPKNLLHGGHFSDAANDRIARAVLKVIDELRRGRAVSRGTGGPG